MNIPEEAIEAATEALRDIEWDMSDRECALAVLEAAWAVMHPEVTTAEELEALPVGTIIRDDTGCIWEPDDAEAGRWLVVGWVSPNPASAIPLPATVIYRP